MNVAIITAVWNDWKSAKKLITELEAALANAPWLSLTLWLVDDGSTERPPHWDTLASGKLATRVIELKGNFGHQRALAAGLGFLECENPEKFDGYVLMDCDGEDRPLDLLALVETARRHPGHVVAAKRVKRSEGVLFRISYVLYKLLFRACTGRWIQFGNFLFLPRPAAASLCHSSLTGRHLAATVLKLQLKTIAVPSQRGARYFGRSRMGMRRLVLHGISAISVFRAPMELPCSTPALDAGTVIRGIHLLKREPCITS